PFDLEARQDVENTRWRGAADGGREHVLPRPIAELGDLASRLRLLRVLLLRRLPGLIRDDVARFLFGHGQNEFQEEAGDPALVLDLGDQHVGSRLNELLHVLLSGRVPVVTSCNLMSVERNLHTVIAGGLQPGRRRSAGELLAEYIAAVGVGPPDP